jgi:DNA modification methylase
MLRAAEWNVNKVPQGTLRKIRESLRRFGVVENNVVRPSWCIGAHAREEVDDRRAERMTDTPAEWYETLSGNHRLSLYQEEGLASVPCVVVEIPDAEARVLAQALNRVRGKDDVEALQNLLRDVLRDLAVPDVASLLPQTEADLRRLVSGPDPLPDVALPPGTPSDSQPGRIYELGPHRVACGSSTDNALVQELLRGQVPLLMVTDPPYGVDLDGSWRDGAAANYLGTRFTPGNADRIAGDADTTLVEWSPAIGLVPCRIVYLWHAVTFVCETRALLEAAGFDVRQQIVWNKKVAPISRAAYHWKHETAWYAVRPGDGPVPWFGGHNQTTVWDAPSPRQIMSGSDEEKADHPSQKALVCFERPIINHLEVGQSVYDPFLGSGTALLAAARTGRVCFGVELNPTYVDMIRRRYTRLAQENNQDPGPGALA